MTRKDCYVILGLCEGASLEDVKKAYRKRAFELHPDLNPSDQASKQFQALNEAYVLMLTWLEEDASLNASFKSRAKTASQSKPEQASNKTHKDKPDSKAKKSPSTSKKESKYDFARFSSSGANASGSASASANSSRVVRRCEAPGAIGIDGRLGPEGCIRQARLALGNRGRVAPWRSRPRGARLSAPAAAACPASLPSPWRRPSRPCGW